MGALFGMLLSLLSERFKLNQIVIGFGLWFLASGLAGSVYAMILAPQEIVIKPIDAVLFSLDPVFYLSIAIFVCLMFFFSKTRPGLAVKAVGENPRAAETAGIDVGRTRWICNMIGSGLIGLAGAYLAIDVLQGFTYTMVSGYGWIAFALVIFGRWETHYVFLGSFVFTATTAIATRLGILGIQILPPSYVVYLPHIAVIVGLTLAMILGKKMGMPAALGQPYER
jgi:simple sugar transport system permease protein